MIDKVIHKHLDKIEGMETDLVNKIDQAVKKIDIDDIIDSPEAYLIIFVDSIKEMLMEDFAPQAFEEGVNFARTIDNLNRDIKVQDSNNPKLND